MKFKKINSLRLGFVLPFVIIAGIAVSTVVVYQLKSTTQSAQKSGKLYARDQARLTSLSGIEYAKYGIRNRTEESVKGIISASTGQSAGFQNGSVKLDVKNIALEGEADYDSTLPHRFYTDLTITTDGVTADGLRPRYKIVSSSHYYED